MTHHVIVETPRPGMVPMGEMSETLRPASCEKETQANLQNVESCTRLVGCCQWNIHFRGLVLRLPCHAYCQMRRVLRKRLFCVGRTMPVVLHLLELSLRSLYTSQDCEFRGLNRVQDLRE